MKKFICLVGVILLSQVFTASVFAAYGSNYDTSKVPSSVVTSTQTLRTAVTQTSKMIAGRISNIISPSPRVSKSGQNDFAGLEYYPGYSDGIVTGLSAGDVSPKFGIWGNASYTKTKDSSAVANSDSDLILMMLGTDYKITSSMLVGFALGYEHSKSDTYFNDGEMDGDGYTLIPYFAYLVNEYISFDLTAGYSWVDYDQYRMANGIKIKSEPDSKRWFFASAIHAYKNIGNLNITGNLGYTMSHESTDAFTENQGDKIDENSIDLNMINVGMETSYIIDIFEPYFAVNYTYDTKYESLFENYDRDSFLLSVGSRIQWTDFLSSELSWSKVLGRDDQSEDSFMLNIRFEF